MVSYIFAATVCHRIVGVGILRGSIPVLRYTAAVCYDSGIVADDRDDTADTVSGISDPVSDCGCFGDAWVLTNWETFGKNVVLFIAAVSVFKGGKQIIRFITAKMA